MRPPPPLSTLFPYTTLFRSGGRGSIIGTLIGALIMSVLINGLRILSIQTEWQNVVVGIVIALDVFLDTQRSERSTRDTTSATIPASRSATRVRLLSDGNADAPAL